eukprot:TRINITY_DN76659_c0_g1_i1.p1 TRINITY_DN76659_c0_g1~~TRINITY_DN76659_c0_g1_i1.p1  ORF type:complete len:934 (-),score=168.33 TRINITY_DN76659_c0_g1_i1:24-2825(-)
MGKSKAAKVQVPACRYGAACTRKDCVYSHPPKPKAAAAGKGTAKGQGQSDKICFAFVAGCCAFGRQCHDKHPDDTACQTIRQRYANIDCQWGRRCRTEGCLYRHPSDAPVGPALAPEPQKAQPAVFAQGPKIAASEQGQSKSSQPAHIAVPHAVSQAADLRDASSASIEDPIERFIAVNAHNSGTQSASLLDLHSQTVHTFQLVLDEVLPERLAMFAKDGVWVLTGAKTKQGASTLFDVVRSYLQRHRFDFIAGQDENGQQVAFLVRGRRKCLDPLEGVRAVLLCGLPGSGKTFLAEALVRRSGGRFVHVSEDELGSRGACEEAFKRAVAQGRSRQKGGSWWWDQGFSSEKHYLAVSFRSAALTFLSQTCRLSLPAGPFLNAVLSYQPTALDLRRQLGVAYRVTFRCHLVLEAMLPGIEGEHFEVVLCAARPAGRSHSRAQAMYIPLSVPRGGVRHHLQVLNAVPADKRVLANSAIGHFKVRQVVDLVGCPDRLAMCVLMHKAGENKDRPVNISFDTKCLMPVEPAAGSEAGDAWSMLADAALSSLDPLVLLQETQGGHSDWTALVHSRCSFLQFSSPQIQVSKRGGHLESKVQQWARLRGIVSLHCTADDTDAPSFTQQGLAVLRSDGSVVLPPLPEAPGQSWPPVALLDRCNGERVDRRQWINSAGLKPTEVVTVHVDTPSQECATRLAGRGEKHPRLKVASIAQSASALQAAEEAFEPPSEREGFKAFLRCQGAPIAVKELIRQLTEEARDAAPLESRPPGLPGAQQGEDDEEEAPPPPPPMLNQWIEVEEQSSRRAAEPKHDELDDILGSEVWQHSGGWEQPPDHSMAGMGYSDMSTGSSSAPWPGLQSHMDAAPPTNAAPKGPCRQTPEAAPQPQDQEDAEEWARQEQLAATLRCMGFDEEPSLQAAQRAGGDLNRAVEDMIHRRGAT